jgi:hypothetical protein
MARATWWGMTKTTTSPFEASLTSLSDDYEYVVRVSAAKMPSKCWGRYQHVAVMRVLRGHVPSMIANTNSQRVVTRWERLNCGVSGRCAARVAERLADAECDRLNALAEANRHTRQQAAHAESLATRSGEDM